MMSGGGNGGDGGDGVGGLEATWGTLAGHATAPWLVPEVQRRLVGFARRFVRDPSEAEDVMQETMLRLRDSVQRLRTNDRAEAWLFRVCRHTAIDYRRKRWVRQQVWRPLGAEHAESVAGPAPAAEEGASVSLAELPAHHRVLMALHYQRGLPQLTVGQLTGLSLSAVRVRLYRARGVIEQAPALPVWAARKRRGEPSLAPAARTQCAAHDATQEQLHPR